MKNSSRLIMVCMMALLVPLGTQAQFLKKVAKALSSSSSSGYTEAEAADAIRQALINGTDKGVSTVSVIDGYFMNPEIKIPFPPEAVSIETRLRSVGLGKQVDKAVLSINRAAEDAAKEAKPIFVAAIKGMSITDAIQIVTGKENAATEYLKKTTTSELKAKFEPVIQNSLNKVNATRYWSDVMTTYNKIPLVQKMNPDLTAYVTDRAIEGLFVMIAKEELRIRKDPVARTTDLLKKVFGSK